MDEQAIRIAGAPGSPYTRKMVAALRYRRIPYRWVIRGTPEDADTPEPPVPIIPVVVFPGESEAKVDSTPLIRELEERYTGRSLVPPDPVLAFIDALIEDFGDEWLTKAMFHYRWAYRDDIDQAAAVLPRWRNTTAPELELQELGEQFAHRQIERLWVVGSNETTAPVIEASYARTLGILDRALTGRRFLLGERPGSADLGVFGQLTQLALFDPTPARIALETAPRIVAWCQIVDDLSGLEPGEDAWIERDAIPDPVRELLGEIGRVYAPFLVANAEALERGAKRVECEIDGTEWRQQPFPYQGKCLRWLRERYAGLGAEDRAAVDALLDGTGCERMFAGL